MLAVGHESGNTVHLLEMLGSASWVVRLLGNWSSLSSFLVSLVKELNELRRKLEANFIRV